MMGGSKIAFPPPQTVATSKGAAPDPYPQEVQVVAPQKAASGPSESPSDHVSSSASCHEGSPRASVKEFYCLFFLRVSGGAPERFHVCSLLPLFLLGIAPESFF